VDDILGSSRYLGGFRIPNDASNGNYLEQAPGVIAYRDSGGSGSLYAAGVGTIHLPDTTAVQGQNVAEISIPTLVNASDPTAMNSAAFIQGLYDPIDGDLEVMDGCTTASRVSGSCNGAGITGMQVYNGELYLTYGIGYDSGNVQRKSHFKRSLTLSTAGHTGPTQFYDGTGTGVSMPGYTGFTAGYIGLIPSGHQAALGGYPMASGWCCPSVITRSSYGPGLGGFDPALVGSGGTPPFFWQPYVLYTSAHQTLGPWEGASPYFGIGTVVTGFVVFEGYDTVALFGSHSTTFCYGEGTSNPAWHDQDIDPDGGGPLPTEHYCYTLTSSAKANHGYPYYYSIWLYHVSDFAAVRAGTKQPWEVVPYDRQNVTFSIPALVNEQPKIVGVTYDPATRRLFLSQWHVDQTRGSGFGIVQVYQVNQP
jgi:hypothetical protein